MNEWLRSSIAALAARAGTEPPDLSDEDAQALLDIARIASHTSGERTNAPLLCYLIGRIAERSPGISIAAMKEIVAERAREAGATEV